MRARLFSDWIQISPPSRVGWCEGRSQANNLDADAKSIREQRPRFGNGAIQHQVVREAVGHALGIEILVRASVGEEPFQELSRADERNA